MSISSLSPGVAEVTDFEHNDNMIITISFMDTLGHTLGVAIGMCIVGLVWLGLAVVALAPLVVIGWYVWWYFIIKAAEKIRDRRLKLQALERLIENPQEESP